MTVLRAIAIAAAFAFATVFDASAVPMPAFPEPGAETTAEMPAIKGLPNAGRVIGGVAPDRLEKSLRAAKAAADAPLRGKLEQELFAKFSRSVVLIVAPKWLGSGTVVDKDGTILTNWHVVADLKTVGVIFKPATPDVEVKESDAVEATVLRVDQIADLALIKVRAVPAEVKVVALGDPTKLAVGADVHAIGHPFGEVWSYTKGIVSQIRANYEWQTERGGIQHRADVVQTQTPINPGNSGGPLLNDAGELVGVATFGKTEGTSINFAVASTEVTRFLSARADRLAPSSKIVANAPIKAKEKECEPVKLGAIRSKKNDATMISLDTNCNGKPDTALLVPDRKGEPILLGVDLNENGVLEAIYIDTNGDLTFDEVHYDTNEDRQTDLIGYDLDENLNPGRIVLAKA